MAIRELKFIAMPNREEMQRRLETAIDDDYLRERFIPMLLKSAGRELVGPGVVTMIQLAIYEISENVPMMSLIMQDLVKDIISALVDDEEVKTDALNFADKVANKLKE